MEGTSESLLGSWLFGKSLSPSPLLHVRYSRGIGSSVPVMYTVLPGAARVAEKAASDSRTSGPRDTRHAASCLPRAAGDSCCTRGSASVHRSAVCLGHSLSISCRALSVLTRDAQDTASPIRCYSRYQDHQKTPRDDAREELREHGLLEISAIKPQGER